MLFKNKHSEKAGVLLETVAALPLFLAGIFIFIWLAFYFHAKTSLSNSLGKALRISVTRGNSPSSLGAIQDIDDWVNYVNETPRLRRLLASSGENWSDVEDIYDNYTIETFHPTTLSLRDMPPHYVYALVYLNEGLKQTIGPSVRYACDPTAPDGDNCLRCKFLNPDRAEREAGIQSIVDPPLGSIGMECQYKPALFILSPALKMLSLMTGDNSYTIGVITRSAFFGGIN